MKTSDYETVRSQINNGDLMLFRGDTLLGKIIRNLDGAYYNHIGLVFAANGRLMILDSNAPGVEPEFLSTRLQKYDEFCIVRPSSAKWTTDQINTAVTNVMDRAAAKHIKYDFSLLLEIAIQRKTGEDLPMNNDNRDICSEFAYRYCQQLNPAMICYTKVQTNYITPWDFIIYSDRDEFQTMWDDSGSQQPNLRKKGQIKWP